MAEMGTAQRLRVAVAEEVRVWMTRRRVTGAGLASAIGRSQAYVSRRLTGDTAFDLDDLERIATVLDVPVNRLFPQNGSIAQSIRTPKMSRYGTVRTIGVSPVRTPRPAPTDKMTLGHGRATRIPAA
jgi:transcriptional regulator with XRE-family HTH domain